MILSLVVLCGGIFYNANVELKSQSNERNTNVQQLEVKNDFINIRKKPGSNELLVGKVYKGDVFTILGSNESSRGTWYKITTEYFFW